MILVTGGAGFIGSNFVLDWLENHDEHVINLDALTYAGNLANLEPLQGDPRHVFQRGDIGDRELVDRLLATHKPRAIVNFAAESHVDRSILGPGAFLKTNIEGTFNLLESARAYFATLSAQDQAAFRFLHVSTDEVYGSLTADAAPFTETHPYEPNSPYSASKAASDHLVRAWHHTYGLPTLTTASPCRSTATASTCATGCTSRTTAAPSARCWSPAAWARPTTSAASTRRPTSTSCAASAPCSMNSAPTPPARASA